MNYEVQPISILNPEDAGDPSKALPARGIIGELQKRQEEAEVWQGITKDRFNNLIGRFSGWCDQSGSELPLIIVQRSIKDRRSREKKASKKVLKVYQYTYSDETGSPRTVVFRHSYTESRLKLRDEDIVFSQGERVGGLSPKSIKIETDILDTISIYSSTMNADVNTQIGKIEYRERKTGSYQILHLINGKPVLRQIPHRPANQESNDTSRESVDIKPLPDILDSFFDEFYLLDKATA